MQSQRWAAVLAVAAGLAVLGPVAPAWAVDSDEDGVDDAIDVCTNTPPGTAVDDEGRPLGDIDLDCETDLADYALFQEGFTGLIPFPALEIDIVSVGNPRNPGEWSGEGAGGSGPDRLCGAVDYEYSIGSYEVTAGQYTQFLNAVAATDTYGLYNPDMWAFNAGCKIERSGSPGNYVYSVADDWADRPVNYLSWGDAARFANWLHNGQPRGGQTLATTEDGSYYLDGAISDTELIRVVREPAASWVIPSEDEWYKAAYHYNDGTTGNYFDYPTSNDSNPSNEVVDPDPGNNATFDDDGFTIGHPYYRTRIREHENSNSPYGTFDQGGNVMEWTEGTHGSGALPVTRGGSYGSSDRYLHANYRPANNPAREASFIGFRVARIR